MSEEDTQQTAQQGKAIDLGYRVGRERERIGLSVQEVAEAIHLRKSHIVALESGAFEDLPGDAYVRGYLRRYTEFLELDTNSILAEYDSSLKPAGRKLLTLPETFSHETHASGFLSVLGLLVAMLCVVIWNIANPLVKAPLVMPFRDLSAVGKTVFPHRCSGVRDAYPPCRWEQMELWYNPVKPDTHIFAVDDDVGR